MKHPQPTILILHKEYEHGSVSFIGDLESRGTGVITPGGKIRRNAPAHVKEQLRAWRMIQKERARLGLPLLTEEEMIISP